jgi:predicted unusual protein kinase regulating ubiquinone biosynthesis (AarF/ABC1/UbiB family)/DNA-binding XRE family transcriptional regulator
MTDSKYLHPSTRLILLRQNLGMTQRELAKEFGVSAGTIAHWETGTHKIPGPVIKLIDLYDRSLHSRSPSSSKEKPQKISGLKAYFQESGHEEALRILEKGFSDYLDEQSSLDFLAGKVKQLLIQRLMKSLIKSRGVSAKVAQLVSFLELGLPHELRNALGTLQYLAKPMHPTIVRALLAEEYGPRWKKTFTHFRDEPLSVTSIGQVHYAQLADGQEVVLKIQHPDIREILTSQINKIEFLQSMSFFLGEPRESILTEVRRGLMQECDYRKEAEIQEKFRIALLHDERIIVPRIHHDLLRDRVLVSDYIKGRSFQTFAATALPQERAQALEALFEGIIINALVHCRNHTDLHPGNFLFTVENKVVLLDFGRVIQGCPRNINALCQLNLACFEEENYEKARLLAEQAFATGKDPNFDFSEFWEMFRDTQPQMMIDDRFHITRSLAKKIGNRYKEYAKRHKAPVDAETFWGLVYSLSAYGLFSELDAKINYRRIALRVLKLATKSM